MLACHHVANEIKDNLYLSEEFDVDHKYYPQNQLPVVFGEKNWNLGYGVTNRNMVHLAWYVLSLATPRAGS